MRKLHLKRTIFSKGKFETQIYFSLFTTFRVCLSWEAVSLLKTALEDKSVQMNVFDSLGLCLRPKHVGFEILVLCFYSTGLNSNNFTFKGYTLLKLGNFTPYLKILTYTLSKSLTQPPDFRLVIILSFNYYSKYINKN